MSLELASSLPHGRRFTVNIGTALSMLALTALSLEPLFGTLAATAFLGSGMLLIVSQPLHSIGSLLRWWPLLLLPAYCLLSVLWSQFPDSTSRYGMQLAFTLAVAIIIACRVPATTLLRGLFLLYAAGILLCLAIGRSSDGSGAWLGIFSSKNAFAAFISLFALTSVGLAYDRQSPRWMRIAAVAGALISLPLLIRAQSAGALAIIGPCVLTVVLANSLRRLNDMQKAFLIGLGVLLVLAGVLVYAAYGDTLMAAFLETSGKDSTLTGRTDLWRVGNTLIAERPLFGVGYRGFWVSGNGPAEQLWAMFGEPSGAGFSFHNTYITNAVELGYVGLAIEVAIIYGAAALLLILAFVRPTHVVAVLLGLQVLLILRSFVEVEVFYEFSSRSMLVYCTFIYAVRDFQLWRAETRQQSVINWRLREA